MADSYNGLPVPKDGQRITYKDGQIQVPDKPIIPFIEGDGTGRDIWKASARVFDAAVQKAYGGKRSVAWYEIFAGEKAKAKFNEWMPQDSIDAIREFRVAIKGPLTTPVGGGIRSLNVTLRQVLDLYSCIRPVKYYKGTPSPVKNPERMNIVIFRENTEDVYAGVEWEQGTPEAAKLIEFINREMLKGGKKQVRTDSGVGIKPISIFATKRLVRMAYANAGPGTNGSQFFITEVAYPSLDGNYTIFGQCDAPSIELVKRIARMPRNGNDRPNNPPKINKITIAGTGAAAPVHHAPPEFGKSVAEEVRSVLDSIYATHGHGAWKKKLMINDRIADSIFQQVVTRADEYTVLATPNLNGDYISDACAAQVGGLGIAPGANVGDGYAVFEATHGTAPKYADKDVINPGSVILSGVMMFRYLGWNEAADLIESGLERTIEKKTVTYDFERLMQGATKVSTSKFADAIIENMAAGVLTTA